MATSKARYATYNVCMLTNKISIYINMRTSQSLVELREDIDVLHSGREAYSDFLMIIFFFFKFEL